jgi:GNAT superfamily N-acetyltransferase
METASPADPNVLIRPATPADVPTILEFTRELADYERRLHEVVATEERLHRTLFGPRPVAEVLVAEHDGAPVGLALFFSTYSTFLGQAGIYLEDLFVRPHARGRGIGRRLLERIAQLCVERDCGRLEWSVLTWNEPAIKFYERLGARPQNEWAVYRLAGAELRALASG